MENLMFEECKADGEDEFGDEFEISLENTTTTKMLNLILRRWQRSDRNWNDWFELWNSKGFVM